MEEVAVATVTLHDGQTGAVVGPGDADPPEPVLAAGDHAKVTLALDPAAGRAVVRFAVDPGARPIVADLAIQQDDELPDLYRAVQDRVASSDLAMAPPGNGPAHLNVFHYLATPDPLVPDAEIRAHIVSTDEAIEVGVPTAAEATSVVAFFRERAPWKSIAVQAVGGDVATGDADVVVTVDTRYDDLTWVSRDEDWVDEDATPEGISVEADDGTARAVPDFSPAATGVGDQPEDAPPVLRVFDGDTGDLLYDARQTADAPEAASGAARRRYAEGQAIVVDPGAHVVRASLAATGAGMDRGFFVEYNHLDDEAALVASFVEELSRRVDDLGVEFAVDVGGDHLNYEQLTKVALDRPDGLTDADLDAIAGTGEPVDFAAPDGRTAFELATFLRTHVGRNPSIAVCSSGRTDDLADIDVVVTPDPSCDRIEPRGDTATRLADGRFRARVADVRDDVETVVAHIEEFTGTTEARQRVLAAALSGDALARWGLTVAPVDDDPLHRRRKQARYLALYGLVLAGVAVGADAGRFEPLAALLEAPYEVDLRMLEGTVVRGAAGVQAVEGAAVVASCLGALLVGAYWLLGYPLGPIAALRTLGKTVRKQVTGGAGSGTVPNSLREVAEPVVSSFEDLHEGYERLADVEGSVADDAPDFTAFLEANVLGGPHVPDVEVVDRGDRWRALVIRMVLGAVVGTVAAAVVLAGLWYAAAVAARDPTLVFDGLVVAAGVTLLVSLLKALVVRYGGGWSSRWSTGR